MRRSELIRGEGYSHRGGSRSRNTGFPGRCTSLAAAWTDDNLLRQVVYQGLREDKDPAEVRRRVPLVPFRNIVVVVEFSVFPHT